MQGTKVFDKRNRERFHTDRSDGQTRHSNPRVEGAITLSLLCQVYSQLCDNGRAKWLMVLVICINGMLEV